jgi:DNA repair exonuclease SbcCD nuclease subunit
MARVLFIGDPHLKINRFDLAKSFLTWVNEIIATHKPELVVNLGDTFDTHAVVRSEILTEFLNHVQEVNKTCPYLYLLGNHDMYKPNDNKYHALKHLKGKMKGFTIVDELVNLHGMTFVPYAHNPENFPKQSLPICVAHQTFKGADFGDITTKDGVDANSVVGAEIIISTGGPEVIYCGSPFSQSASDINQVKGVSIFDTETFKEEFIQCPLPMWKGVKYTIDGSFSADEMHEDLMLALNDKDHWIIEITGPKAEVIGYLGSKKGKSLTVGRDVKIKTIFTDKEKRQVRIEAVSLSSIVSQYLDKVYAGSIDKDTLKAKAHEIHELLNSNVNLV